MPLTENQLYNEAILLPNPSKIFLVEKLLENIGENIDSDAEGLQIKEAKRRRDEIRSGQVLPVPGENALKQVRKMVEET
jgi:hypothetical protein